jgi:hydroxyethylthiazole kinase-like uncharacterized protein yjeF
MLTGSQMARVDRNAAALGVSQAQLMESSGNAVARAVRERTAPGDDVVVVAGRGNNGGDGFVAARFLDDRSVTVLLLGRPVAIGSDVAADNWAALDATSADTRVVRDSTALVLPAADLLVDAVLGTGVSGAPREPAATAVRALNAADAPVLSVDVPTGLDAESGDRRDPHVKADHVVAFHDTKPGLAPLAATVEVADIGVPAAAERSVGPGDLAAVTRTADGHKGDHGEVLVVGGGPYTGAPALTGQAALRAGADLVTVAAPAPIADEVQGFEASLVVDALDGDALAPEHVPALLDAAAERDALVVGPGLGDADRTREAVRDLLAGFDGTAVVDADALAPAAEVADETAATLVCTPHRGELRAMGGPDVAGALDDDVDAVAAFAADTGVTLLLKGATDVVTDGERTRLNDTGNAGMTVGGTGDVLAGVVGALAATTDPFDAAAVGAYAAGTAGDEALDRVGGYGIVAADLLPELPAALWGDR